MNDKFQTVIGLEVHVQLATRSKLFCSCPLDFNAEPNTNICPVCCGYPGVLPVMNEKALDLALQVCIGLDCDINPRIYFERKNYFYPDLPKGYQISQYKLPLGEKGKVEIAGGEVIRVNRVHLEEDAGKLIHKAEFSLVDLNRTGVPLLEIVTEPDITSPDQAFDYLTQLKLILQYIGASSCDMEKGFLRCDANISLKEADARELGTKVELKNMNSFRGVRDALEYERQRQRIALDKGEIIRQETRLWDEQKKQTLTMRSKEAAHDYRYFPEPDLVVFNVSGERINARKEQTGELPLRRKQRIIKEYNISDKEAEVVISSKWLADFFEKSCVFFKSYKKILNLLIGPFLELIRSGRNDREDVKITPENFARIVERFSEGVLNNLGAKKVLAASLFTNEAPDRVIERQGLTQVSDEDSLITAVKEAITENPKPVSDYLSGKQNAVMFIVGCVMKKTRGKANPKLVREILEKEIKKQEDRS